MLLPRPAVPVSTTQPAHVYSPSCFAICCGWRSYSERYAEIVEPQGVHERMLWWPPWALISQGLDAFLNVASMLDCGGATGTVHKGDVNHCIMCDRCLNCGQRLS